MFNTQVKNWNFNEVPKGVWDIRANSARDPNSIFPPLECLVVNSSNERIPYVFYVNFDTGRVGKYVTRINEWGLEVVVADVTIDDNGEERKKLREEWINSPGVKIIPFPPGYKEKLAKDIKEKKSRYIAQTDGTLVEREEKGNVMKI